MPTRYIDDAVWVVASVSGSEPSNYSVWDWLKFTTAYPCPTSHAAPGSNGRQTGFVSGATEDEARREFEAWFSLPGNCFTIEENARNRHTYTLVDRNSYPDDACRYAPISAPSRFTPEEIARNKRMMNVKLTKESGKLYLIIDASGLHETLEAIGCQTEVSGSVTRFKDRPYSTVAVLDPNTHTLSTELMLAKGPQRVDLSTMYTRPPTAENLKKLANSANEKCRAILDHYQPIDIQVTIQKKVLAAVA